MYLLPISLKIIKYLFFHFLLQIAVQFPQELCRDAPPVALLLSDALQPSCDVTIIYNSRAAR